MAIEGSLIRHISRVLSSRQYKTILDPAATASAVLVLLLEKQGKYHVLLTRRSKQVAHHKGEISFPGGRADAQDRDLLDTALRECHEEIGLRREDVKILGRLDDVRTLTTGFVITPHVGVINYPYPFRVNSKEIDTLIFVPIHVLNALTNPCGQTSSHEASCPSVSYQGHEIWGATARILRQFLQLICLP
ncbi:MAG: CoA pyrophosphatase [Deltaproteobacteria bacterium]|nr:CoA pyrophosphatase [Deltaproteobacteria bacterium]